MIGFVRLAHEGEDSIFIKFGEFSTSCRCLEIMIFTVLKDILSWRNEVFDEVKKVCPNYWKEYTNDFRIARHSYEIGRNVFPGGGVAAIIVFRNAVLNEELNDGRPEIWLVLRSIVQYR